MTISAGSLLDSLAEILAHPSATFAILAKTVPTVVGYFVMLLLTLIFVALPLKLLRLPALFSALLLKLTCKEKYLTPRELDEMYSSQSLDTGYFVSRGVLGIGFFPSFAHCVLFCNSVSLPSSCRCDCVYLCRDRPSDLASRRALLLWIFYCV